MLLALYLWLAAHLASTETIGPPAPVEFTRDVRPILQRRCQPCHFEGGSMYAKLPFDRGETVTKLGTKLFTRIKDEREQATIRAYLAKNGGR
jgi:hypothetical protein